MNLALPPLTTAARISASKMYVAPSVTEVRFTPTTTSPSWSHPLIVPFDVTSSQEAKDLTWASLASITVHHAATLLRMGAPFASVTWIAAICPSG